MKKVNIIIKVLVILLLTITINTLIPKSGYCENQDAPIPGDVPQQVVDDVEKAKEEEKRTEQKQHRRNQGVHLKEKLIQENHLIQ